MVVRTYNRATAEPEVEAAPAPDPGPSEKDILIANRYALRK
jgi:large conductance mechanosensitive channel